MVDEMIELHTNHHGTNATRLEYTNFPDYETAVVIWKSISPLLIVIGTVGSILSLTVLCRRRLRNTTTMFYLAALAVADIFVLYTGLLRYWIYNTFDIDVRLISDLSCKIHIFLVYTSLNYAAWILVALTADRCIYVCAPFRARNWCTVKNARRTAAAILVALVLLNSHMFWTHALRSRTIFGEGVDCDAATENMTKFLNDVWPWIDFCVASVVPFSVMIVCNFVIIRQLAISAKKIRQHKKNELKRCAINRPTANENADNKPMSDQSRVPKISVVSTSSGSSQSKSPAARTSSLTVMLLSVNCVFLLLTSPIVVFLVGFPTWSKNADPRSEARLMLIWSLVNMFQYVNNAGHFFLYCLSGPRFRKELMAMMTSKNKVNVEISQTREYYG